MNEVKHLEMDYDHLDRQQRELFLNLLNSDILSSIEKNNVTIELKATVDDRAESFEIRRKERNLDAEELFMEIQAPRELSVFLSHIDEHFAKRLQARIEALNAIGPF
jgi:hypothetical protein